MKLLLTVAIFFVVPLVLFMALMYAVAPLFVQRFLPAKKASNNPVYSYQTSWEEAA